VSVDVHVCECGWDWVVGDGDDMALGGGGKMWRGDITFLSRQLWIVTSTRFLKKHVPLFFIFCFVLRIDNEHLIKRDHMQKGPETV
jgi:hypothetical protein